MTHLSTTTRLLMAAAHLYPEDFKDDLKERSTHPFKSPAPEFGIDLAEIQHALDDAKLRHFAKSAFLFVVSYAALSLLIETENWKFLFVALFLTSLAELVYLQSATRKARTLINNNHDPTTASCFPLSTDDFCERRETLYHWRAKNAAYGVEDAHDHAFYKKNVMISGGYSPFIGAGFDLDSWSFTIDLSEPEDEQQPVAGVTAIELHDYIQEHLTTLQIDEMTISDELLVNGQDVNTLPHLLPDGPMSRPVDCVDKNYIVRKIASNDKKERHYRVVRIPMWDGQIFLSMYYRFLICNYNLFCEARFFCYRLCETNICR